MALSTYNMEYYYYILLNKLQPMKRMYDSMLTDAGWVKALGRDPPYCQDVAPDVRTSVLER
jgi:hypothetical protein